MANKIKKKSIEGTLYFPLIASLAAPFLSFNAFRQMILPFNFDERWVNISSSALETFNAPWVKVVLFQFISNIVLFLITVVLLISFFQLTKHYTKMVITYFILKILLITLIFYFQTVVKGPPTPTLQQITGIGTRSLLFTGIWIPYFLLSERVRETFIY